MAPLHICNANRTGMRSRIVTMVLSRIVCETQGAVHILYNAQQGGRVANNLLYTLYEGWGLYSVI